MMSIEKKICRVSISIFLVPGIWLIKWTTCTIPAAVRPCRLVTVIYPPKFSSDAAVRWVFYADIFSSRVFPMVFHIFHRRVCCVSWVHPVFFWLTTWLWKGLFSNCHANGLPFSLPRPLVRWNWWIQGKNNRFVRYCDALCLNNGPLHVKAHVKPPWTRRQRSATIRVFEIRPEPLKKVGVKLEIINQIEINYYLTGFLFLIFRESVMLHIPERVAMETCSYELYWFVLQAYRQINAGSNEKGMPRRLWSPDIFQSQQIQQQISHVKKWRENTGVSFELCGVPGPRIPSARFQRMASQPKWPGLFQTFVGWVTTNAGLNLGYCKPPKFVNTIKVFSFSTHHYIFGMCCFLYFVLNIFFRCLKQGS